MRPHALLDVNALLALVWADHADHSRMVRWHRQWQHRWALCVLTESAFLRLSLNPAFTAGYAPVDVLLETLRSLRSQPGCEVVDRIPDITARKYAAIWKNVRGHQQVMDAMLVCTAVAADMRLATMDQTISDLADRKDRVILIP